MQVFGAASVAFLIVETLLVTATSVPSALSLGAFAAFGAISVLTFTILGELFPIALVWFSAGLIVRARRVEMTSVPAIPLS